MPRNHSNIRIGASSLLMLAAATFAVVSVPYQAEAKHPNIKREAQVAISFDLSPTASAPVEAEGTASIDLRERKGSAVAKLKLNVTGLAAGDYSVDATKADASVVHIGDFNVAAPVTPTTTTTTTSGDDVTETEDENELELTLPSTLSAQDIVTLTVSTAATETVAATVVLTGDAQSSTSYLRFFANVKVTAPAVTTTTSLGSGDDTTIDDRKPGNGHGGGKEPKAKKVHGTAVAQVEVKGGVEKKRSFLFVAFGAPADSTLNLVIDDQTVGTVTSTKQGKVMFKSLPETVKVETIDLLTITDANGVAVMQADF